MRATTWILSLGLLLGAAGCKKGNDDLKKKVTALRDKSLACKDAACVQAASNEYIELTKDLSGLSESDAKFFDEVGTEILQRAAQAESAPK
jgi:phage shock protein A